MKKFISSALAMLLLLAVLPLSLFGCQQEGSISSEAADGESSTESTSTEESTPMIVIKDDPNYKNVALEKSYTKSPLYPDDNSPSYPDENGVTATDGKRPDAAGKYSDPTFMGFNKNHSRYTGDGYAAITVDLGSIYYLDKFTAVTASSYFLSVGITAPKFAWIYVSNDGNEWYRAGKTAHTDTDTVNTVESTLTLESALTARYVQYRFIGDSNWIMVAEVEAYGIPAEAAIPYPKVENEINFLFVGNSSTYYFDVPYEFLYICEAAGINVNVEYCTIGAAYLSMFADANDEKCGKLLREKLAKKKYDYVVIQDNSNADYPDSKAAMDIIVPLIKENGAEIYLYKRYSSNTDSSLRPSSALRHHKNYTQLAKDFGIEKVAPVADAFLICEQKYKDIKIFHTDNSHHSQIGAYLIASIWAITFFDVDIDANSYTANLDTETLTALRECAKQACSEGYSFPEN